MIEERMAGGEKEEEENIERDKTPSTNNFLIDIVPNLHLLVSSDPQFGRRSVEAMQRFDRQVSIVICKSIIL